MTEIRISRTKADELTERAAVAQDAHRRARDAHRRQQARRFHAAGWPMPRIAGALDVPIQTVEEYLAPEPEPPAPTQG